MKESDIIWEPQTLWWIITAKCNLDCRHCYIKPYANQLTEIDSSMWDSILSDAHEAGIKKIYLTGGEPFLTDLEKLISISRKHGLTISDIETNGLLIKKEIVTKMDSSTVFHISYDSFHEKSFVNEEVYHYQIQNNIQFLHKNGFEVRLNTAISSENKGDIEKYYDKIKYMGISEWDLFFITKIGRGKNLNPLGWKEEVELSRDILNRWARDGRPFRIRIGSYLTGRKNEKGLPSIKYLCEFCKESLTLLPNGKILPCCRYIAIPHYYKMAPTIGTQTISSIIRESWIKDIKLMDVTQFYSIPRNSECISCSMNKICGFGCPVNAYLESGNLFNYEEKHCRVIKGYYSSVFSQYDFEINGGYSHEK